MIFTELPLPGAYRVALDRREDDRGWFARAFCTREFAENGLPTAIMQSNLSYNTASGTLRGMHYQREPYGEAKLVRVIQGRVYDVIIDLRPVSPAYCRWYGTVLDSGNAAALYIPAGMAHGFLTLEDETVVHYEMFTEYHAPSAAGVRYNDPLFGIEWIAPVRVIAEKDRQWADYQPEGGE
ncbi:MAG: dTDP-4-dehydrorhamnose 3,5-epimerase family protein [Anaerolineae bacterium]|nr:dTDP-4-dehydrorhamnose 3,5-epimerase family protein [Anaerolineae bacterium]